MHEPRLLAFPQNYGINNSMSDVVQSVRQLLQDFIAPELRELKGDVKGLDVKIGSETKRLEAKIDLEISRLEDEIHSESRQLGADLKRLDQGGFWIRASVVSH